MLGQDLEVIQREFMRNVASNFQVYMDSWGVKTFGSNNPMGSDYDL